MSGSTKPGAWPDGLVIIDKPGGMTSHDVVARVRRLARTRRVGHAGTLDPMATGVLVVGIEKATRLLGHLTLTEKTYEATIRLGQSTTTDDAEGEVLPARGDDPPEPPDGPARVGALPEPPDRASDERKGRVPGARITRAADVSRESLDTEIAKLTGEILQVPSSVSAIKVNGQRAYKLTRAGEAPELAARPVTIHEFRVTAIRQVGDFLDLDATIRCSSGTYIRALARDLGAALGTGGHLTTLRRTAVGPYTLDEAHTLKTLEAQNQDQNNSPERVRLTPNAHPTPHPPEDGTASQAQPMRLTSDMPSALRSPEGGTVSQAQPARLTPDPCATPQTSPGTGGLSDAPGASQELATPPASHSAALHPPGSSAPSSASVEANGTDEPPMVPPVIPLAEAAAAAFPGLDLTEDEARRLAQGARLPIRAPRPAGSRPATSRPPGWSAPSSASAEANGTEEQAGEGNPIAAFAPDGTLVALVTVDRGQIRSLAVFADLTPRPHET